MDAAAEFAAHRSLLFGIAYRMLGSVADADDVVQDAYLRWQRADHASIDSPRAYLSTVTTRLSIDALRLARRQREVYVGDWLPEPLQTAPAPDASAELAETLSTAFLVLLESLAPPERAAFLLREVFSHDYSEIAEVLGKTEANCRQMVKRAKDRLASREHRFEPSPEDQARLVSTFLAGTESGDYGSLVAILAEDAVLYSDHGGKAPAAQRPIFGADKIARFLLGVTRRFPPASPEVRFTLLNGRPGLIVFSEGVPNSAFTFDWIQDRIHRIYVVRNPEKLSHLSAGHCGS